MFQIEIFDLIFVVVVEIRILAFPCNQFLNQMPYGDGDEMLCHLKTRNAAPGAIMAKVRNSQIYKSKPNKIDMWI